MTQHLKFVFRRFLRKNFLKQQGKRVMQSWEQISALTNNFCQLVVEICVVLAMCDKLSLQDLLILPHFPLIPISFIHLSHLKKHSQIIRMFKQPTSPVLLTCTERLFADSI